MLCPGSIYVDRDPVDVCQLAVTKFGARWTGDGHNHEAKLLPLVCSQALTLSHSLALVLIHLEPRPYRAVG